MKRNVTKLFHCLFLMTAFLVPATSWSVGFDDPPVFDSVFARALPNYIVVHPGLSRSGRPDMDGLRFLKQEGFRTILNIENDMRAVQIEAAAVQKLGMQYVSIPMSWQDKPTDDQVNQILKIMNDPKMQPVLLHCKHGRDRTGLMMGLHRVFVDRWAPRKAYEEMLATGFRTNLKALDQAFRERTGMGR